MEDTYPEPDTPIEQKEFSVNTPQNLKGKMMFFSVVLIFLSGMIGFMALVIVALSSFVFGPELIIMTAGSIFFFSFVEIISLFLLLFGKLSPSRVVVIDFIYAVLLFAFAIYTLFNGTPIGFAIVLFVACLFGLHGIALRNIKVEE